MTIERGTFDAGSDFANPAELIQESMSQPAPAPEPAAEDVETPAGTWADSPQDPDAEPAEGQPASQTTAADRLEIKGNKGVKEFELRADNPELQRTLKFGLVAPKWKKERDEARARLQSLQSESKSMRTEAGQFKELQTLARGGHTEHAVRGLLGEEAYAQFVQQLVGEYGEYESADPLRRMEIDRQRETRAQAYKDHQTQRKLSEAEAKLAERENAIEYDRIKSLGTHALQRFDFSQDIDDADLAHAMNQKLWVLSLSDLTAEVEASDSPDDVEITPQMVMSAFARNAKILKANSQRQAKTQVTQTVEKRKQDATRQAQVAATERYPTKAPNLDGWDGRSSKDLLRRLTGRK